MWPPGKRLSWNERTRWQGSNAISRARLRELKLFPGLKIERIRINQYGQPEYIRIQHQDGRYIVDSMTPEVKRGFYGSRNFVEIVELLSKEYGLISVI